MNPELIKRINQLAKKEKEEGLSPSEKLEQKACRDEYLKEFRKSFRQRLENIEIEYIEDKCKS